MTEALTLALAKGRILDACTPIFRSVGIDLAPVADARDRRLAYDLPGGVRVLLVKPVDVPTYVEHGIAQVGVAGRDTLEEAARDLYEPVDLGIGACRMVVAAPRTPPASVEAGGRLRVATKYPRVAARYFRARGVEVEVIPLYGSIELAPITGLADQIVDLVESGETLRQNDLVEIATVFPVTSRLVVQPASLKLGGGRVDNLIAQLRASLPRRAA